MPQTQQSFTFLAYATRLTEMEHRIAVKLDDMFEHLALAKGVSESFHLSSQLEGFVIAIEIMAGAPKGGNLSVIATEARKRLA